MPANIKFKERTKKQKPKWEKQLLSAASVIIQNDNYKGQSVFLQLPRKVSRSHKQQLYLPCLKTPDSFIPTMVDGNTHTHTHTYVRVFFPLQNSQSTPIPYKVIEIKKKRKNPCNDTQIITPNSYLQTESITVYYQFLTNPKRQSKFSLFSITLCSLLLLEIVEDNYFASEFIAGIGAELTIWHIANI